MNLAATLAQTAGRLPDKPAILFHDRPVGYAQLDRIVSQTAGALAEVGVERGDRVALIAGNVPEFVYGLYGALRAGAVAVPLNVMLTSEEIGYILADARAKAVIVEMAHLPSVLEIRDRLPDLETVFVVTAPPVPARTMSFEEAVGRADELAAVDSADDDLALIQYTAGTTASPKGAMLSHGNLVANLDQMQAVPALAEAENDVVLLALPVFHIYALNSVLNLTFRVGATAVLVERFRAKDTIELIREHRVSLLPGVPPMYYSWIRARAPAESFETVRLAVSGASPLPAELFEGFRQRYGVPIWEGYGLTEASPAVTSNAVGRVAKPLSIGLPLPGVEIRIVDEQGEEVEDDPGEILVRGPNVFRGYWGKEEESAAVLVDGWLRTGDVAYRDEDGYLFLVDRKKDLIIVSGFNVYPKEVEDALVRLPGIEEAAVVGVPDARTGEAVRAYVVARADAAITPENVIDGVSRYIARFKVPKEVEIVAELPRHPTGKVLRRALRGEETLGGGSAPT